MTESKEHADRLHALAALLDAVDELETSDPRFDAAVARCCLIEMSLSAEDRDEVERIRTETSEKLSRDDLIRHIRRLRDDDRHARIQQICFRIGVTIGTSLFGKKR